MLKRAFQDTSSKFTDAENLARLSHVLKGAAREAVSMLLVMATSPNDVLEALDRRFGRPEQIVLQEVNAVRALPKLGTEVKELHIFTTRVRNCVEVAKLVQHSDYLRSPELFGALLSKLSPLLRARWLDFAETHEDAGQARVELLSHFLNREVDLTMKFGGVLETVSSSPSQQHRAHTVAASGSSAIHINKQKSEKNCHENVCLFCQHEHQLTNCQKCIALTVDDKWRFIKDNKICHRCLQKVPHNFRFCKRNKAGCTIATCNLKHHTLLHNDNFVRSAHVNEQTQSEPTTASNVKQVHGCTDAEQVHLAFNDTPVDPTLRPLLKVVAVTVSGPAGSLNTFALLDDGSTATFIDADVASQIGAEGPEGQVHLDCVGGLSKDSAVQFVDFEIKGRSSSQSFLIKHARSIKNLGLLTQSATRDSLRKHRHLADLVEVLCYDAATPTLIIGIDNWHLITASEVRKGTNSQPVAIRTPLGWVLFGFSSSRTKPVETTYHVSSYTQDDPQRELEALIKDQYRLDSIGIVKYEPRSADDQRALSILENTAQRLRSGRFQVGLLWKSDDLAVPDSYPLAFSRFRSLELKMSKDPEYAKRYRLNIHDTLAKGYAEECTAPPQPTSVCWYLPHFGVINPNKPTKLRVVHDAAAKVKGVSLNSMLLPGPDLLQPLLGILMRFREGKIALTADIKEMFPQVKIRECDRDAQRFLWRDEPKGPIKIYRMSSMIFGACSSPATAIYIVNKNASQFREEFPEAVHAITSDTYMDDYIGSLDTSVENAARLAAEIVEIYRRGGFEMRGWISNELGALSQLPKELLSDLSLDERCVDLGSLESTFTRTLGLIWRPFKDVIGFNFAPKDHDHLTKRVVLAEVMRIYDPLGILAPIVVRGRILLSESDQVVWRDWLECHKSILGLRVPRCYNLDAFIDLELHVFCDASELAHAAVAYWRFTLSDGSTKLALIASKARVSPLKPASIPRLELQGALIATRLAAKICEVHRLKPSRRVFWCDSMTVLGWLRSDARNYKPFVAHRVGEILENTVLDEWHWVPTEHNVADDATRGKSTSIFRNRDHIFQNSWVQGICLSLNAPERLSRPNNFASTTAPAPLDAEDIIRAERHILGWSLLSAFGEELHCLTLGKPVPKKSRLAVLSPVLKDGLLRLAGRTSAVTDRQPVILDGKEPAVRLLILRYHTKFAHANTETVINELRQEYWVIGLRNAVRSVVHKCQLCKLLKSPTLQPPMGDLPEARLAHHRRPFTFTGIDYFGPLTVTIGRRHEKRWVALFTCLVTRAVHLEIVASLSADSAVMCLKRFIARRGTPSELFSDNGTSFVGANRELKALYQAAVPQFAADQKITWRFIPPSAPFMGGAWERLIRSVKTALKVTLRERAPRKEVLSTLLAEAEAIVNSRPLTHISPEPEWPEALTPNHFLLGDSSGRVFPGENLTDAELVGRSGWRKALRLSDHFWRRWVTEYLPTLAPRRVRGTDVAVKVGDPVLIGDGELPRGTWPRGVIAALYPGRDGVVRVVDVRTPGGILKRPLKKIVPL
ncbi:hypothetical protein ABMA28_001474 [Loxostege sticticalis]|uniref:Integrase catalytic domain-containing protein n=1 Tax=Loxostege sticticalis TaxID=481309 RepID=A0ABD0T241_LOXSC